MDAGNKREKEEEKNHEMKLQHLNTELVSSKTLNINLRALLSGHCPDIQNRPAGHLQRSSVFNASNSF